MTLFRPHERICLDTAPDAIKQEPFGEYMKCVQGDCKCRAKFKFVLTEADQEEFRKFTAGMTTAERQAFMDGVKTGHHRLAELMRAA